ncbi:tripartite tricarboxylate transporter substrate binding protein [soil metagenome]
MQIERRRLMTAALATATLYSVGQSASAQDAWPSKPIRMILPYAGGGSADTVARAIADQLRASLGQMVIVESRPGANSMLGAEMVATSPADGYTLLYLGWPTISTNLVVYKDVRYKLADFQPLTTIFTSPVSLTVRKDLAVSNLKELLDYARKQGGISFGTSGVGSSPHLLMERLSKETGVPLRHVPYKGESPAVLDVIGGHLPVFAGSIATPLTHIRAGTLKVVATSSDERLVAFPEAPTFKESGFKNHVFTYWHGFALPANTPKPIVDKFHAAIVAAMNAPQVRQVLSVDQIPTTISPAAFKDLIQHDIDTWAPVIRAANLVE